MVLLIALLGPGCFGAGTPGELDERTVGREGGTLDVDGARLIIPAGALDAEVPVSLRASREPVVGHLPRTSVITLTPADLVLHTPARLELSLAGGEDALALYVGAGPEGAFVPVGPAHGAGERVDVDVDYFAPRFVGDDNPCGADLDNDPDNCGACGNVCPADNGEAACVAGACVIDCDAGAASCDDEPEVPAPGATSCPAQPLSPCKNGKVEICHIPPGNPANAHTICVSENAIPAHLGHGDGCGPCADATGCEAALADDPDNCGACGVACSADASCSAGACACDPGFRGDGFSCTDIDECAEETDTCHKRATCIDTAGSYECRCEPGYRGDGETCTDIDECAAGTDQCAPEASCSNTPGSYTCSCPAGFTGDGFRCAEIDECALGLDACAPEASCTNVAGSYSCACESGYDGDGFFCTDFDECAAPVCDPNASCSNRPGAFDCTCNPGWTGDGFTCADRNECADGSHSCDVNATCANTVGGFSCACGPGWSGDGASCADVDECALGIDDCSPDSECVNTPGSFWCDEHATCAAAGSGTSCACEGAACAVNECQLGIDRCDPLATCTDTAAGYTCTCPDGYAGDGVSCTDIDECDIGAACGPDGQCMNLPGSYECQCPEGTEGDGRACADIDECARGTDACSPDATCTNTIGGYLCECVPGFVGDGFVCEGVDECATGEAMCDPNATCIDEPGTYRCECNPGWQGPGLVCDDIDECALGIDTCDPAATCTNTAGSYECSCPPDMSGDGLACACPQGFEWDGQACVDVDECAAEPTMCGVGTCVNQPGGCTCQCPAGYRAEGRRCVATNPCAEATDSCDDNATCVYDAARPGEHTCACDEGWEGDGFSCADIDECARGLDDCAAEAACENLPGTFACHCPDGYSGDGRSCAPPGDPDECALGTHDCAAEADCLNTDDGWQCRCRAGYTGDGRSCANLDECALGSADCGPNGICLDTDGGYECACVKGYLWDGTGCADIDECAAGATCGAGQACVNEIGGYQCVCAPGYGGPDCRDIDECALGTDDCGPIGACVNEPGSYACVCPTGYQAGGGDCFDVDECKRPDICPAPSVCENAPGGYLCLCGAGFADENGTCVNIDECALGLDDCASGEECLDTVGGYQCQCPPGLEGANCTPVAQCAVDIAASGDHTCAILDTGALRCWGGNYHGELGYGHREPIGDDEIGAAGGDVPLDGPVAAIAAGVTHNCALLTTGAVTCWGRNAYGQLGYGHTRDIGDDEPASAGGPVSVGAAVVELAAGGEHTCARLADGKVRCWGLNVHGQLGYGHTEPIGDDELPSSVGTVALGGAAQQIVASRDHSCALLVDGSVRCWGRGERGQLGHGNTRDVGDDETPAQAGPVPIGEPVAALAAGWFHTCALTAAGAVRCWGYGSVGALGHAETRSIGDDERASARGTVDIGGTAIAIEAGAFHTCALMASGDVRCWGYGAGGRLGHEAVCNVGDDEPPSAWGPVSMGGAATDIATGFAHSCALVDGCAVRCWGEAAAGQLGYGDRDSTDARPPVHRGDVPIVPDVDECARGTDTCGPHSTCINTIGSYGCLCDLGFSGDGMTSGYADEAGQCHEVDECSLGGQMCGANAACVNTVGSYECVCLAGFEGDGSACIDVNECARGTDACAEAATCANELGGYDCTCAPGYAGDGWRCVDVDECALGTDLCEASATCVNSAGGYGCACAPGWASTGLGCEEIDECALGTDDCAPNALCTNVPGSYECACRAGFRGDGYSCEEVPTYLVAGGDHSCAIVAHTALSCWGANGAGQLGRGHGEPIGDDELARDSGWMSLASDFVSVAAGTTHTCAAFADGTVRCWGDGAAGRLGYGDVTSRGASEPVAALPAVDLGGQAVQVAAGGAHSCALLASGGVRCWGAGYNGNLGYADTANVGDMTVPADLGDVDVGGPVVAVATGGLHTCALLADGAVRCWGYGSYGQLGYGNRVSIGDDEAPFVAGDVALGRAAVQLALGDDHSCALLDDGTVRCWGRGSLGRLGLGDVASIGDTELPSSRAPVALGGAATMIAAGARHSCAILDTGEVRCWGQAADGRLGRDTGARGDIGDDELPTAIEPVPLPNAAVAIGAGRAHTCALTVDDEIYCWGAAASGQLGAATVTATAEPSAAW